MVTLSTDITVALPDPVEVTHLVSALRSPRKRRSGHLAKLLCHRVATRFEHRVAFRPRQPSAGRRWRVDGRIARSPQPVVRDAADSLIRDLKGVADVPESLLRHLNHLASDAEGITSLLASPEYGLRADESSYRTTSGRAAGIRRGQIEMAKMVKFEQSEHR